MAKKIDDLRQYWQEIATKAGLSQDVADSISESLGNESVAKAFRQGFVPVPEHHSTLDEIKNNADARVAQMNEWYNQTALPAYQTNLAGIERLRQYESVYGELDPNTTTRQTANDLGFKSKAELDSYIQEQLRSTQQTAANLMKVLPKLQVDYYNRFKEVLDLNEVEKLAVTKGLSPEGAYNEYISPKVEEQRQKEFELKLKEAREQGERDAVSKYHLPVDTTPKESNPFFGREPAPEKANTPLEEDRASRSAFLDGWNTYAEGISKQHRS